MNKIGTVIKYTYTNKIRSKSFIISTLVLALIMTILAHVPLLIKTFAGDDDITTIGYVTKSEQEAQFAGLLSQLINVEDSTLKLQEVTAANNEAIETAAAKLVTEGDLDGYIVFGEFTSGIPSVTYKSEALFDMGTTSALQQVLQAIKQQQIIETSGLSAKVIEQLNTPVVVDSLQISYGNSEGVSEGSRGINMWIIYGLIIVLFMGVMFSGNAIAGEVTMEKSSRVMEVLITSVSPVTSMFGKIMGMFLLVITQLSFYVIVVTINISLPYNQELLKALDINFNTFDPSVLIFGLIYFFAGFFLFSVLYAALGSIVSRTEDLAQAIMPMTLISLAGFYIAMFNIATPDSMMIKVCSYIPFVSPFTMLLRIGLTNIATWEILVSLAILLVTIYVCVIISAKIYRVGVLMYGKRPSMKELFKAVRMYK